MADIKFNKGDLVRLKSGGPVMTGQAADYSDSIQCTWFDDKKKRETEYFDEETLENCKPSSPI